MALLATAARSDVIMDWNAKADAIAVEKQLPNAPNARGQAMLHVAMFEAVNAIDRRYAPYKLNLVADRAPQGKRPRLPRRMTCCWRSIPTRSPTSMRRSRRRSPGLPSPRRNRRASNSAGQAAAGIIALRADDGSNAPESYRPVTAPGVYVPTAIPIESTSFEDNAVGDEHRASQFRPAPPPALTSETWTRDLNEIREIGSNASTKRTAEQTTIARFWFFTGPRTYNTIVSQVAWPGRWISPIAPASMR